MSTTDCLAKGCGNIVRLMFLAIATSTGVCSQGARAADLWVQIEEVAASVESTGEYSRIEEVAKEIAQQTSRAEIEEMVRSGDANLKRLSSHVWINSQAILTRALLNIADPHDKRRQWNNLGMPGDVSWHGAATAAIDNYHDARSRDLLVELALKERLAGYLGDPRRGSLSHGTFVVYATGLLRGYDPGEIRPKIEAALKVEEAKEKPKAPPNAMIVTSADYLRALLESWNYAATLKPAERDRYRDFERRLWRAWALAGGWKSRKADMQIYSAADYFWKHRKDGDERFLKRISEVPTSTVEEKQVAGP